MQHLTLPHEPHPSHCFSRLLVLSLLGFKYSHILEVVSCNYADALLSITLLSDFNVIILHTRDPNWRFVQFNYENKTRDGAGHIYCNNLTVQQYDNNHALEYL